MINGYVNAFWYLSNNFGDALNHYIIKAISGKIPVWVAPDSNIQKVVCIGSILNQDIKKATIWGCGIANKEDVGWKSKKVLAVRGNLLANKIPKYKGAIGDPALLIPRFYTPKSKKGKYKMGVIPHYIDMNHVTVNSDLVILENKGVKIIDILDSVENVIDAINECECIISSSLHGLIIADAYEIPCEQAIFTNKIGGDGFKYLDYFSCFDVKRVPINFIQSPNLTSSFINMAGHIDSTTHLNNINISLDKLYDSCPFKP